MPVRQLALGSVAGLASAFYLGSVAGQVPAGWVLLVPYLAGLSKNVLAEITQSRRRSVRAPAEAIGIVPIGVILLCIFAKTCTILH